MHKLNTTDDMKAETLKLHVPMLWNVYFDNVGGPYFSDAVLYNINKFARMNYLWGPFPYTTILEAPKSVSVQPFLN